MALSYPATTEFSSARKLAALTLVRTITHNDERRPTETHCKCHRWCEPDFTKTCTDIRQLSCSYSKQPSVRSPNLNARCATSTTETVRRVLVAQSCEERSEPAVHQISMSSNFSTDHSALGDCGQPRRASSAALRSSFRVAPPAACIVMPYITIDR
jgi:hypothetical protein